ncbi:hypothetical protein [Microbacterium sp. NPDC096154]|uniref:hypothetical protein n=1 Tax=Microbacterium sp. NPDC096154 TaxID=3155549 RepID=UPI003317FAC8
MLPLIAGSAGDCAPSTICTPAGRAILLPSCGETRMARVAMRLGLWLLERGCAPRGRAPRRLDVEDVRREQARRAHALAVERTRAWGAFESHRGGLGR